MNNKKNHIESARQILISLGMPRAQQNERSALCIGKVPSSSCL